MSTQDESFVEEPSQYEDAQTQLVFELEPEFESSEQIGFERFPLPGTFQGAYCYIGEFIEKVEKNDENKKRLSNLPEYWVGEHRNPKSPHYYPNYCLEFQTLFGASWYDACFEYRQRIARQINRAINEELHFLDSDEHITRELQRDIFWEEEDLHRRQTLARILQDTFDIFL